MLGTFAMKEAMYYTSYVVLNMNFELNQHKISTLNYFFSILYFPILHIPPENRKSYGLLMFSRGIKMKYLEQVG